MAQNYKPTDQQISEFIEIAQSNWKTPKQIYDKIIEQWWRTAEEIGSINFDDAGNVTDNVKNYQVINKYKDKEWNEKTYDEKKADEWSANFNELVWEDEANNVNQEDDTSNIFNKLIAWWMSIAWANFLKNKLLQHFWAETTKELLKAYWPDLIKYIKTWWGKLIPVIAAVVDEAISLHWVDKALTDGSIWWTWNWWKDAWQAVAANIEWLWWWDVSDSWYANKWEDKEVAKEKQKTNRIYRNLWGNFFSNLTWIEWLEWWYLKEERRIKKELWDEGVNDADRQISTILLNKWKDISPENVSKFKKSIIDKWYKYKQVKDKNWNTTYTWVNKNNKPLISESI